MCQPTYTFACDYSTVYKCRTKLKPSIRPSNTNNRTSSFYASQLTSFTYQQTICPTGHCVRFTHILYNNFKNSLIIHEENTKEMNV